jgi:hypothetical protein
MNEPFINIRNIHEYMIDSYLSIQYNKIPYITIRFITSEYINNAQTLCSIASYVPAFNFEALNHYGFGQNLCNSNVEVSILLQFIL